MDSIRSLHIFSGLTAVMKIFTRRHFRSTEKIELIGWIERFVLIAEKIPETVGWPQKCHHRLPGA